MTDETARREQRRAALARAWRPSTITINLRGTEFDASQADRWEAMLRAERSLRYRLARLAARVPGLRWMLGVSSRLAADHDGSLEERESRVAEVGRSALARFSEVQDRHEAAIPALRLNGDWPASFPAVGPALDSEIDAALHLLESMPFEELQRRGWHLQKNHFYVPLNDVPFLREHPELWTRCKVPAGIDWHLDDQLRLLERLAAYAGELEGVPDGPPARSGRFVWENGSLARGDAYAYYGLIREQKPRRVIEIGGGWPTLLLGRAIAENKQPCKVTLIDPAPNLELLGDLPRSWDMIESPVQLVDPGLFEELERGDVVFYDGSHSMRTGGDVNWVFFDILPRLAPGVWIHVHDLFWPWDYPPKWVLDEGYSFNEQYLVQAFLMGNSAYRARLAMSMLAAVRRPELRALLPEGAVGGSVWIEKRHRFVAVGPAEFESEVARASARAVPPRTAPAKVEEVMTPLEACVTEGTTIAELSGRFRDAGEAVPVIGEGEVLTSVGPDAVIDVLAAGRDPAEVTVREAIGDRTRPARQVTVAPDASLEEADGAMIVGGVEHALVARGARVVGVVSRASLDAYRDIAPDGLPFPPEDLMKRELPDAPRRTLAKSFFDGGARTAHVIRMVLRECGLPIERCSAVLEDGCGAGRVIRHFRHLPETRLHGSDGDADAIAWCRENLRFAEFVHGEPRSGLDYADDSFDLVYAAWASSSERESLVELRRLVKRGGMVLVILPGGRDTRRLGDNALETGLELVAHLPDAADSGHDVVVMAKPAQLVQESPR
jgi:SAM-dependent methyltransferase/CBS domain-containing protein